MATTGGFFTLKNRTLFLLSCYDLGSNLNLVLSRFF